MLKSLPTASACVSVGDWMPRITLPLTTGRLFDRAFASSGPLAIIVDAAGRVAEVLSQPTPDAVAAQVTQLHAASRPAVVQAKAPVLLLERVAEPRLCRRLIDY